jgi:hypothetical protein
MLVEDQDGAAPVAAEAPAIVDSPAPAPVETVNDTPAEPVKTARDTAADVWDKLHAPRDDAGKFTPKAPDKVEPGDKPSEVTTDTPASPAPAGEAPKAPVSWPQDKAEAWTKLDPDAREFILKREAEVAKGFQTTAEKYKPLEEVDRLLEPYKAKMQAEGLSPAQGIQRLLRAQDIMERNPIEGINWLARSYGVNLGQLTQQQPGQEQTTQPLNDPRVETLQQRIDRLEAEAQTRAKQEADTFEQSLKSEVDKFRASPEHPHFKDVKDDMAALLSAGVVADLKEAYEKAVWANPTARTKVLEDQRKAEATKAADAAAKAKQAGSLNVRSTPANAAPPKNARETMAQAWDAAQNR